MTTGRPSVDRFLRLLTAFALIVGSSVRPASAQVVNGAMAGSVVDSTGKPIARAAVRVEDDLHALSRTVESDGAGLFRVVDLPPASYRVTATASGFTTVTRADVTVAVGTTTHVSIQMPAATITEAVKVTATVPYLQTMSGDLGTVLDRARIESLPLNRRDFLQLALLAPGVEGPVENSELSTRGGFSMHANGAREEFNNFLLDGVDNNDPYVNRYLVQPSVDSVEEFRVATNSYSAEYGRNAGGQVNVVTRRGTSRVTGSAYEYFRNQALNARNYFETGEKQPFSRNQFGGGAGGPLLRDGTFFFGSLDVLRENAGLSRLSTVPGSAERRGDLSSLGRPVIDPFTGTPFAGNVIPDQRISPIARRILNMFPSATQTGAANYLGQPTQREDHTLGTLRVDHRLGADDALIVRYSDGIVHAFEPFTEGTGVTSGFGDFVDDRTWNVMAEYRQTMSRATNSLRFGGNAFSRDLLTENHSTDVGAAWGVDWLSVPRESFGYPIVDVAGYSRVGDAFSLPILRDTATYQVVDDFSINAGAHLVKLGGEARHVALDSTLDLFSRGQLSFTGAFTGSGIGDLLLGLPTFGIKAQSDNPIHMRTSGYAAYAQDDWRFKSNLTLNLGLRYEYMSPPVDAYDAMSIYDASSGQLVQAGTNGVSRSGISPDRNNLAPRIGVSWMPARRTVVRGGFGVFYDSGMLTVNTAYYFNPPYFNLRVFVPGPAGLLTLTNPFPTTGGFVPPPTLSTLADSVTNGYLQHWNGAVQQEFEGVGTVTVAYAGSKGSQLFRPRNLNQAIPGPGDVQARRPNPDYADIFYVESAGRSRFDSLQLTFDRPLSQRQSLLAVYTLAKSSDDASAFLGTPSDKNLPQDSRNPDAEWGPSSYDVRHRLTVSYIVHLPGTNMWTRDMQVQGITTMHTGQPFTPILRFDNSNSGNTGGSTAGSDRPNLVGDARLDDPTVDRWFDTAAFAVSAPYTFGNAGRNSVRGPGFASFDIALAKDFRRDERRALTVGVQVFNLFNRANFNLPEHLVDEPTTFGRIFSAKAPRQVQLTARLAF